MANDRLISRGRMYPSDKVLQQVRVAVGNAAAHAAELEPNGWAPANTDDLSAQGTNLSTLIARTAETRTDAKNDTQNETQIHNEGAALYRKIRAALGIILRDGPVDGLTTEHFTVGETMRTTRGMLIHLEKMIPLVARLDAPLGRFFPLRKPSEMLSEVRTRLAQADTEQEVSRAALPQDTVSVLELKGRILDLIDDLNAVARIAFDGQAELGAKFNKDLLIRGRRTRKAPETPETPAP